MKKYTSILLIFGMLALVSCEEESNMDPVGTWTLSAPMLASPADNAAIILDANQNQQEFTFNWDAASSSEGYNVSYRFLLLSENADTLYALETSALSTSIIAQQFDGYLAGAGVEAQATSNVQWHVTALSLDKTSDSESRTIAVTRFEDTGPANTLYIIGNGVTMGTLVRNGDVYQSNGYISLQQGQTYAMSTSQSGAGISYGVATPIGTTGTPNGDNVNGSVTLTESGNITVARDMMYNLTVNVDDLSASWQYYNLKLFHWDEDGGGWNARTENAMTYTHPYTFTVSVNLIASYHSKFFSPWDILFGSDTPSALVGTMTNAENASNFDNINTSGAYDVTVVIAPDFGTGDYEFVLQ